MDQQDNFYIQNIGSEYFPYVKESKKARSFKRKLGIVASFVGFLALIPFILFGINFNQNRNSNKISSNQIISPISTPIKVETKTEPKFKDIVLKHDSYWKIAKRNCGSGKYYLAIQNLNFGKPLFEGESVLIDCSL